MTITRPTEKATDNDIITVRTELARFTNNYFHARMIEGLRDRFDTLRAFDEMPVYASDEKIQNALYMSAPYVVENESAVFELILGGITKNHTGKMAGMMSFSTAVSVNPFCQARRDKVGCICEECYSAAMAARYSALDAKLTLNSYIMNVGVHYDAAFPDLTYILNGRREFRLEAFGDVASVNAVANYYTMCRRNPSVRFTAWTKNPNLYQVVADVYPKPANLRLIYSDPDINGHDWAYYSDLMERFPVIDEIFTVYSGDYVMKEFNGHQFINCGARSCKQCGACYGATRPADIWHRELIKSQSKMFYFFSENRRDIMDVINEAMSRTLCCEYRFTEYAITRDPEIVLRYIDEALRTWPTLRRADGIDARPYADALRYARNKYVMIWNSIGGGFE